MVTLLVTQGPKIKEKKHIKAKKVTYEIHF